jgi:SAM-dependent methyltransferase
MGRRVVAFDIHGDLEGCLQRRVDADLRIRPELVSYERGDVHGMPFPDGTFSHVFCYDTLHHMHDYGRVFGEFARVLEPGGRALFVEPGARHSSAPETIAFVEQQKVHDPTWIERDVVLEEIDGHAQAAGFTGLTVVPMPHPDSPLEFSLPEWREYRDGADHPRLRVADYLAYINYEERVIFYCDRPG